MRCGLVMLSSNPCYGLDLQLRILRSNLPLLLLPLQIKRYLESILPLLLDIEEMSKHKETESKTSAHLAQAETEVKRMKVEFSCMEKHKDMAITQKVWVRVEAKAAEVLKIKDAHIKALEVKCSQLVKLNAEKDQRDKQVVDLQARFSTQQVEKQILVARLTEMNKKGAELEEKLLQARQGVQEKIDAAVAEVKKRMQEDLANGQGY